MQLVEEEDLVDDLERLVVALRGLKLADADDPVGDFVPDLVRFVDPGSVYRLDLDTAFLLPFRNEVWALKLGVRNAYNSRPASGSDRLDNTFYANVRMDLAPN